MNISLVLLASEEAKRLANGAKSFRVDGHWLYNFLVAPTFVYYCKNETKNKGGILGFWAAGDWRRAARHRTVAQWHIITTNFIWLYHILQITNNKVFYLRNR